MKTFLSSDDVQLAQHYLSLCASLLLLNRGKEAKRLAQIVSRVNRFSLRYSIFLFRLFVRTKPFWAKTIPLQKHLNEVLCINCLKWLNSKRSVDGVCFID